MSDTPRTDAELKEVNESEADNPRVEPSENGTLVNACFARRLERELVAAKRIQHAAVGILIREKGSDANGR